LLLEQAEWIFSKNGINTEGIEEEHRGHREEEES
jgi:hypothetical protein